MAEYTVTVQGETIRIRTEEGIFSPEHADRGTLAMLSHTAFEAGQRVLDLGCGCGLVGILAAKKCGEENVFLIDRDEKAADCALQNAADNSVGNVTVSVSDGFRDFREAGFDLILSNPPYQTDFAVAKHFIEKGFNRLKLGGRMLMVTKRLDWYRNKLRAIFGGVRVYETDGYYVFEAEKRDTRYAGKKRA